jgi:hypothetical protein
MVKDQSLVTGVTERLRLHSAFRFFNAVLFSAYDESPRSLATS